MTTRSNLWAWRPLRVAGRNRIAVYQGAHLVTLLSAHELDDAWAFCGMRNQESEATAQQAVAGVGRISPDMSELSGAI